MRYGNALGRCSEMPLVLCALSIVASGCALENKGNVVSDGKRMDRPSESEWPQEVGTIHGVNVQLAAKEKRWNIGVPPILRAGIITDHTLQEDVFVATHVGLGCRVSIDGRWYTHPQITLIGVAYHNIRKIRMELNIVLDNNWRPLDGGKTLPLGKGSHTVRFAWAGYTESEGKRQPLLLLSNEVEIVINAK